MNEHPEQGGSVPQGGSVTGDEQRAEPFLRIVRGDPAPDELAAVTVALTALTRRDPEPASPPAGGWSDLSLRIRRIPAPGPGAWRNSAWS